MADNWRQVFPTNAAKHDFGVYDDGITAKKVTAGDPWRRTAGGKEISAWNRGKIVTVSFRTGSTRPVECARAAQIDDRRARAWLGCVCESPAAKPQSARRYACEI